VITLRVLQDMPVIYYCTILLKISREYLGMSQYELFHGKDNKSNPYSVFVPFSW